LTAAETILVVDDDDAFRELVAEVLEPTGCDVRQVSCGAQALRAARESRPALVVLDVCMPLLGGYSVLRELRAELGDDLPVVLVSGERTDPLDTASGLLLGADDYISKPFCPDELLARLRRLLPRETGARAAMQLPGRGVGELTPREREVLRLLADGLAQREIARALVISEKTVETHIQRTLSKLGVHSRAQAVALAHRERLVDDEPAGTPLGVT
jgi:DNA-binding NarL/FixJ family response regulator